MAIRVVSFSSAAAFLARAESWLLEHEVENNLILGVADRFRGDPELPADALLATLEDRAGVCGCAMLTPPYHLVLTGMPVSALTVLADHLRARGASPPGVMAPATLARSFAALWCERTGASCRADTSLRIHRLDELVPPPPVSGEPRVGDENDLPLVAEWMRAFAEESGVAAPGEEALEAMLDAGDVLLWADPDPVSMAAVARRTPNGAAIAYVFTPPERRGRRYGSAVTAALSADALASGSRFCFLFTDRDAPTPNRIYARLGYRPVCDLDQWRFGSHDGPTAGEPRHESSPEGD